MHNFEIWHKCYLSDSKKIWIWSHLEKSTETLFWGKNDVFRNIFLKNYICELWTSNFCAIICISNNYKHKVEKLRKFACFGSFGAKMPFLEMYF